MRPRSWQGILLAAPLVGALPSAAPAETGDISLLGSLDLGGSHGTGASRVTDVWGYKDQATGRYYALVGDDGDDRLYIVDVTLPQAPTLVSTVSSFNVYDVKAWGSYAYVCDSGAFFDGTTPAYTSRTIDLTDPANPVLRPEIFRRSHNLTVTSEGHLFLSANGGLVAYDLNVDPFAQSEYPYQLQVGLGGHDATQHGSTLFDFGIGYGVDVWDLTTFPTPTLLQTVPHGYVGDFWDLPGDVAHSGDVTEDGRYLYVTDEAGQDGDVIIWDLQDTTSPANILDDPAAYIHNLYIEGNLGFVSYYSSGFRVYDVSDPHASHETQTLDTYDTSDPGAGGQNGAWGVYPFDDRRCVYVSDTGGGLFVFRVDGYTTQFGHVAQDTEWGNQSGTPDTVYVSGDLIVDAGYTLTIHPGTTVLVSCEDTVPDPQGLYPDRVEIIVEGALEVGTSPSGTITFEADCDEPTATEWAGISWATGSTPPVLENVVIRNAHPSVTSNPALMMTECTVEDGGLGLDVRGGATIDACTFTNLPSVAVRVAAGDVTITDLTVTDVVKGVEFNVSNGSSGTLSVSQGLISGASTAIHVVPSGSGTATIDLDGVSASNGITGVSLMPGSGGDIRNSTLSAFSVAGILMSQVSGVTVENCQLADNGTYGILLLGSSGNEFLTNTITGSNGGIYADASFDLKLEGNTLSGNGVGVAALNGATPDLGGGGTGSLGNNSITQNSAHHVANLSTGVVVMAEDNWWGSSGKPKATKFSGAVDYTPWLTSPPGPTQRPAVVESELSVPGPRLLAVAPNPFARAVRVRFEVSSEAGVDIAVFDTGGRRVATLLREPRAPGVHEVTWDGRGEGGDAIAAGMYFVRMTAGGVQTAKKVLLRR